jgi:hypothetical protein
MWCVVDQNEATTQGGAGGGGGGGGINSGCGYHHRMYRVVVLPPPPPPPPPPPGTTGGGGAMLLEGSSWEQDESDGCIGAKPALSGRPVSDLLIAKWWSDQFPKTGSGQKTSGKHSSQKWSTTFRTTCSAVNGTWVDDCGGTASGSNRTATGDGGPFLDLNGTNGTNVSSSALLALAAPPPPPPPPPPESYTTGYWEDYYW